MILFWLNLHSPQSTPPLLGYLPQPHWPPSSFSRMPGMLLSQGLAFALSFAWMTFLSDIIKFPSLTSLKLLLQCHFLSDGFSGYQASNYHYTTPHLRCLLFIIFFSLTYSMGLFFFLIWIINPLSYQNVNSLKAEIFVRFIHPSNPNV